MSNDSPVQLVTFRSVQEYAKERGFEETDFEKNGWQAMPLAKAKEALGHPIYQGDANAFALVFHYYNPDRTPMQYATIRIIRSGGGFASQVEQGPKMLNPARKPPRVYFSRCVDWINLSDNSEIQIHESVVKAEAAIRKGYLAIGISGCWGWCSKQHRIPLLEDFGSLPWAAKGLRATVVFDSNTTRGYPEFQELLELAIQRFAGAFELEHHVPVSRRKIPPGPHARSWGYDDWCMAGGGNFTSESEAIDSDQSRAMLEKLNSEFAYDHALHRIIQIPTPHSIISIRDFKDKIKPLRYQDAEGDLKPASEAWLVWTERRETFGPVYRPGAPTLIEGRHVNFWDGWGVESVKGDASPFYDLLNNCLTPEEVREFLMWMAFGIQRCGEKKSSKVPVLVGPEGVGKSAVFRVLGMIHGEKNCSFINTGELESGFNSYIANKTLVVVDDFTKMDNKTNAKLRNISTNETIRVNAKFQPEYTIDNTAALAFTGNEYDGIKMEEDARRYFVLRMQPKKEIVGVTAYWEAYWDWATASGAAALRWSLENLDIGSFRPYGTAMLTEGKKVMARASQSALANWLSDVKEHIGSERLFATSRELDFLYVRSGGGGQDTTPNRGKQIGDWLAAHGYRLATELKVKVDGVSTRVWAINTSATGWDSKAILENMRKFPLMAGSKADDNN